MYWARADGAGEPVRLAEKPLAHPDTFSSDGKWLMYHVHGSAEVSLWTLPVDATDLEHPKPGEPQVFLQGPRARLRVEIVEQGTYGAATARERDRKRPRGSQVHRRHRNCMRSLVPR
jgi:hypothetical protein